MDPATDDFDDIIDNRRMSVRAEKFDPEQGIDHNTYPLIPKSDSERKKIEKVLKRIYIFNNLTKQQLTEIINYVSNRKIVKNQVVMNEDGTADDFYMIQQGIFEAYRSKGTEKTVLCQYENEGYFGELALIYDTPRCATIKALSDGMLWVLDGRIFRHYVQSYAYNQRAQYEALLASINMLNTLSDYDKSRISDALTTKEYVNDDVIIEEGTVNNNIYIVAEGEVSIVKTISGAVTVKGTLKRSEVFGYEGIIFQKPTSFVALASGNCKVVILSSDVFKAFLTPLAPLFKERGEQFLQQIK